MASSDETPGPMPPGDGSVPPGKSMSIGQHVIDKGAQLLQTLKPIKHMNQHVCTFAMYSHDMTRQIETHHYVSRVNQDFLQCAVYDSDDSNGRLIGDRLPLGAPALMMSPQGVNLGMVAPELVKKRDERYGISSKDLEEKRVDIAGPETTMNPYANYWMQTGKGFAIDVELTDMKKTAPFP
ncbi:hypothetical protein CQW23_04313 [Capsicum baccatum]|uniref:Uncharacterized protein n=1 Tax=Capsicum baccatum TaxID=33114 RepID=A0A2G2XEB9_CAPBA|nr:hypothetical protein CQW23_04313 [Capsicum baccatum]